MVFTVAGFPDFFFNTAFCSREFDTQISGFRHNFLPRHRISHQNLSSAPQNAPFRTLKVRELRCEPSQHQKKMSSVECFPVFFSKKPKLFEILEFDTQISGFRHNFLPRHRISHQNLSSAPQTLIFGLWKSENSGMNPLSTKSCGLSKSENTRLEARQKNSDARFGAAVKNYACN